jgi:hypothetical protein
LEIYVDYHTLFFSNVPDTLTQLGWALRFYGVSFRYAPTPRAKGKIERGHQFWQERLPAYFASEQVSEIDQANNHLHSLRQHRNEHEIHRELQMKHSKLGTWRRKKNARLCGQARTAPGGICASRPLAARKSFSANISTGHHFVLKEQPNHNAKPTLLFTILPKSTLSPFEISTTEI